MPDPKTFRAAKRMTCGRCGQAIEREQPYRYDRAKSGAEVAIHNPRCPK